MGTKAEVIESKTVVSTVPCEYCEWIKEMNPDPEFAFCRIHGDVVLIEDEEKEDE